MADLKTMVYIEVKKNDRTYVFSLPFGCPLGEAYDAAHEVLQSILDMSKQAADNAKQRESSEAALAD